MKFPRGALILKERQVGSTRPSGLFNWDVKWDRIRGLSRNEEVVIYNGDVQWVSAHISKRSTPNDHLNHAHCSQVPHEISRSIGWWSVDCGKVHKSKVSHRFRRSRCKHISAGVYAKLT